MTLMTGGNWLAGDLGLPCFAIGVLSGAVRCSASSAAPGVAVEKRAKQKANSCSARGV